MDAMAEVGVVDPLVNVLVVVVEEVLSNGRFVKSSTAEELHEDRKGCSRI